MQNKKECFCNSKNTNAYVPNVHSITTFFFTPCLHVGLLNTILDKYNFDKWIGLEYTPMTVKPA